EFVAVAWMFGQQGLTDAVDSDRSCNGEEESLDRPPRVGRVPAFLGGVARAAAASPAEGDGGYPEADGQVGVGAPRGVVQVRLRMGQYGGRRVGGLHQRGIDRLGAARTVPYEVDVRVDDPAAPAGIFLGHRDPDVGQQFVDRALQLFGRGGAGVRLHHRMGGNTVDGGAARDDPHCKAGPGLGRNLHVRYLGDGPAHGMDGARRAEGAPAVAAGTPEVDLIALAAQGHIADAEALDRRGPASAPVYGDAPSDVGMAREQVFHAPQVAAAFFAHGAHEQDVAHGPDVVGYEGPCQAE